MTLRPPRIALFADSFHETNGVALTCREWERYAAQQGIEILSVHAGPATRIWTDGPVTRCELATSAMAIRLERDLYFDMRLLRHRAQVLTAVREFQPDLVHITGPSHIGLLGLWASRKTSTPLTASWHTNLHEYAGRRLGRLIPWHPMERAARDGCLRVLMNFYRRASLLYAPNPELIEMLKAGTGRPCQLMRRGVDCGLYNPDRRRREDDAVVLGFAGRLSPEKNVGLLGEVEQALRRAGVPRYRFVVAGDGTEREALRRTLRQAEFLGVVKGAALADAYANMDVFLFPSETDTYGNVIQEAMASGVPCVVTNRGGPQYLVASGTDGFVTGNAREFCAAATGLAANAQLRMQFSRAARQRALEASWYAVFREVYRGYSRLPGTMKRYAPPDDMAGSPASVSVGGSIAGSGIGGQGTQGPR